MKDILLLVLHCPAWCAAYASVLEPLCWSPLLPRDVCCNIVKRGDDWRHLRNLHFLGVRKGKAADGSMQDAVHVLVLGTK